MTERLKEIFSNLDFCRVFADVGCDHGYVAKAMLDSGKCETAIVSDISAKCLKKAEDLLSSYIEKNRAKSVVSDGFKNVGKCDLALVAGMGGEEIVSIINNAPYLPEKLVLQPMKNADKVRETVVGKGYKIVKDYVFSCGKIYYDLIVLERGDDSLTEEEKTFGRTNILSPTSAFKAMINDKIKKYETYLELPTLSQSGRDTMCLKIEKLKKYV